MGKTIVKRVEGMQFIGQGESGHAVVMDASPDCGGSDSAANPVEILLCALGGCVGIDTIFLLQRMKTELDSLWIEIDDERAEGYPKVITKLHMIFHVTGEVPEKNLEKAINLALSKHCPVANTLAGVAEITSEYIIEANQ